ncbi:MAG: riboflavin kinase, partial [Bacteroidota bacterium]
NFDQEIYGTEIEIIFKKKIRDEMKFSSIDALKEQLHLDITQIIENNI